MAAQSLEEQLRRLTECKICFEEKEHQKQLPCQHTLCLDCLTKLEITDSKYKCPMCVKEHLVPNGGLAALPESLVTKQLASLIHSRPRAQPTSTPPEAKIIEITEPEPINVTPTSTSKSAQKLKRHARDARDILEHADKKVKLYVENREELSQTEKEITDKINKITEEQIERLLRNASEKVTGVQKATKGKRDEVEKRGTQLQEAFSKAGHAVELMEQKAAELESAGIEEDIESELRQAHACVDVLRRQLQLAENQTEQDLREGASVILKLEVDQIDSDFLEGDLDHSKVGYIQDWNHNDEDDDCAVIFPGNARWVGKVSRLEKSPIKHDLPVLGDKVRVRETVGMPFFKWQDASQASVGYLTELKNKGPKEGREVRIDFPEDHNFIALFEEIEKTPTDHLKVGDAVWMSKYVTEPSRGWAGVTSCSVGTLLSVNGDEVAVSFPECERWQGLLSEIERVRRLIVGDKVKVKKCISEPKTGWGGVSHQDEGVIKGIEKHDEYGEVGVIDFPNISTLWRCPMGELEIVSKLSVINSTNNSGNRLEQLIDHASSRLARQLVGNQCPTQ